MDSTKERALKTIDGNREAVCRDLAEIVRIPSIVGSEGKAQEWIYERMRSMGLAVEAFEADKERLMKHPYYVTVDWPYQGRPNVIGVLRGDPSARSIILA